MGILISCFRGGNEDTFDPVITTKQEQVKDQSFATAEITKLRSEANRLQSERHTLITQSQTAYKSNKKSLAHTLSLRSKSLLPKITSLNARAVSLILSSQNLSSGVIDLHGLYLPEVLPLLSSFISDSKNYKTILIITGAGHHSKAHDKPVIRPKVEEYLTSKNYKWKEVHKRGAIEVELKGTLHYKQT
ncbi:hypothetical protein TrST_g5722 [Triparma strigata]|uniref:Smr domain-containing protein n=1 Tax=Triparma strigata TaxID=1606541 RepID=A0A9W7AY30_9STRA|nr:hypothetical protein TrST_g5722 [Triparma strigata]